MIERSERDRLDDALDALKHIKATAELSRTQSRRLRWIALRAQDGIDGTTDWQRVDLPARSNKSALDERRKMIKMREDFLAEIDYMKNSIRKAAASNDLEALRREFGL